MTTKRGSRRRFAGAAITGDMLRKARLKAGLTQTQLGDLSGYHPIYISELERGRSRIGPRAARALLLALER